MYKGKAGAVKAGFFPFRPVSTDFVRSVPYTDRREGMRMKKLLLTLALLVLLGFLSGCAWLEKPRPDYRERMIAAALRGDTEAGLLAAAERNTYLDACGSSEPRIDFDELLLLGRCLTLRAGDERLSQEQRLCTGEVLLNRVASPDFPDTLEAVLAEEGAFPEALREGLHGAVPDRRCVEAAWELLSGRRMLDSRAVLQCEGRPLGPVCATFCDRYYRVTYFCMAEASSPDGGAAGAS